MVNDWENCIKLNAFSITLIYEKNNFLYKFDSKLRIIFNMKIYQLTALTHTFNCFILY